jgi:hypothetical protein
VTAPDPSDDRSPNLFPAVAILTVAIAILAGFVLYQGIAERSVLLVTLGAQEQPLQQSQRLKEQLDALARATAKLAEQGNRGAQEVVDLLKKQGITIHQ